LVPISFNHKDTTMMLTQTSIADEMREEHQRRVLGE
jgi:hypothetical protein